MGRFKQFFEKFIRFFHLESWARLLMLCVLVGVLAGLGGVLLDRGLHYLSEFLQNHPEFGLFNSHGGSLWGLLLLLLVPAAFMLLASALAAKFAPEARGQGLDAVIDAFHRKQGYIRPQVPLLKGLCSILTIGAGGSAGKEGPIAQIGAGFGSFLGGTLGLSVRDRRILMLAGCAGGVGAVLRAPLGGALFAAEMLYREPDFEHDVVIPGVISSVTAYSVFTAILGHEPILSFRLADVVLTPRYPSLGGNMFGELLHYALLSLFCAVIAFLVVKGMRLFEKTLFPRLPMPAWTKPGIGGLALGALAALAIVTMQMQPGQMMGEGKEFMNVMVQDALVDRAGAAKVRGVKTSQESEANVQPSVQDVSEPALDIPRLTLTVLLVGLLCKIVATGLTVGSGGSGGLLFPMLFLGAMTGAAYAKFWQGVPYLPDWLQLTPMARAGVIMVAMGGVFCGCTKTPIASLVMVSEMTGSYGLSVPLMLCCASTYLLTTSFTMDEAQVKDMSQSPAHRGDFLINVLEDIKVGDAVREAVRPELIHADLPFSKVLETIKNSQHTTFPIVDDYDYLVGVFSLSDIRQIMNEQSVGNLVVAGDLGTTNVVTVTRETNLSDALSLFTQKNINVLPVVETVTGGHTSAFKTTTVMPKGLVGTHRVIALLTRQDLIAAYRRRLQEIETLGDQESAGSNVFEQAQVSTPELDQDDFFSLTPSRRKKSAATLKATPSPDASKVDLELLEEPKDDDGKVNEEP